MNIVIVTNILSPYRRYFFDEIYKYTIKNKINFNVILMAETEKGRDWKYENLKTDYTILLKSKTINIKDDIFIHFNLGLKKILSNLKPDIVIVGGSYIFPTVWRTIYLRRNFNYKLLFWSESHLNSEKGYSEFKIKIRELIRNKLYKSFDGFCYSGKMSKELIDKYAREDKEMYFLPNLVQPQVFREAIILRENKFNELRKKYNIDESKYVFICPARLEKVKGIKEFINVYSKSNVLEDSTLIVCGDGELRNDISELINKLDNIDVRLLGNKSQEELVELYSISNCFLLPSLSDANPLTCIEALWAELPLLVSKHVGNYPEVIVEGKNGYSFSYNNINDIIEKLNILVNSDPKWQENSKKISMEIAEKIYNPKNVVKNLINRVSNK